MRGETSRDKPVLAVHQELPEGLEFGSSHDQLREHNTAVAAVADMQKELSTVSRERNRRLSLLSSELDWDQGRTGSTDDGDKMM